MGGYAAMLLSRPLSLDRVFLISPQVSPFADVAPFDRRYRRHEDAMARELHLQPEDIRPEMRGFVIFDPWHPSKDAAHARMIAAMAPRVAGGALSLWRPPRDTSAARGRRLEGISGPVVRAQKVRCPILWHCAARHVAPRRCTWAGCAMPWPEDAGRRTPGLMPLAAGDCPHRPSPGLETVCHRRFTLLLAAPSQSPLPDSGFGGMVCRPFGPSEFRSGHCPATQRN